MTPPSQPLPPSPAEARYVDWENYESPEHGFATKFPERPTSTMLSAAGESPRQLTWADWDGAVFAVFVLEAGDNASINAALHDAVAAMLEELFGVESGTIPASEISTFQRTEAEVLVEGHTLWQIQLRGTAMGTNYAVHSRTIRHGEHVFLQISLTEETFRPFFPPLTW